MKKVYILIILLAIVFYLFSIFILKWITQPVTCATFSSQEEAQRKFLTDTYKYRSLDRDNDNQACEDLPKDQPSILFRGGFREPRPFTTFPPKPTPAPTPATIELKGNATVNVERSPEGTESPTPRPTPEPTQSSTPAPAPSPTPVITPTPTPIVCVGILCLGGGVL